MCGIAGIIQLDRSYTGEHLRKMTDALAHRGPDGEGFWQNQEASVLFGHRRLSIIDLSESAAQPFYYLGRYRVLHNGEIYNYLELRHELQSNGYQFRTQSDTEVLAAAFDCWKEECLEHFDGMFAFAIWDEREQEFFAARDRFGEKPFYYLNLDNKVFLFASEIKAFWTLGLGKEFNRRLLFNFLTIGYTDNPQQPSETFYEDVRKLPPASFMAFDFSNGLNPQVEKYWDIDIAQENKNIRDKEAIERFRGIFETSVERRLRSDVSLGTSLSGGLDSSSVVAAICNPRVTPPVSQNKLQTFSIVFPGFEKNEEAFIDQVSQKFSTQSSKAFIGDEDIPELFKKTCTQQDEPFTSASALAQDKIFELAKKNGVKVLLDGQGADETLAGYHKYYKWYWQELFRKRRLGRSGELKKAKALGVLENFGTRNIIASLFPDFASVVLEKQYLLNALRQEDLARDFVRLQSKEAYYSTPPMPTLNGILYFNSFTHGLEELLRYADRNSMAHGREVRLPFLSHELVEFLFSLPSKFKIRDGWTKWILRKAMDQRLPASITWRKDKIGLEPPQYDWMKLASMREMIQEAKRKLVNEKILKPAVLDREIQPATAYEKDTSDWKYLVSAQYL